MLLNSRVIRNVFEGAEAIGLTREDIVRPLGLDAGALANGPPRLEWGRFTELLGHVSHLLGDDAKRLRELGRRMSDAPSYGQVRQLMRGVVSMRALFRTAERWMAPANFPHLRVFMRFVTDTRVLMHFAIPQAYAPCEPFMHILQGTIEAFPTLLGLAPGVVVESHITPRTADFDVDVPRMTSLMDRARRVTQRLFSQSNTAAVLEAHRHELADTLEGLRYRHDELRALLEGLPDPVLIQASGTIVWANRALLGLLGHERRADLTGTPLLEIVAPRSRAAVGERMRLPVDQPGLPALLEVALLTSSRREVIVEVTPPQAVVFDGVAARLIAGRDVSERAQLQEKLLVADRLASVGLLAAGVGHEVNNPLAYILNNIEIARKELVALGAPAERANQVLGVALEGVDRIRAIVRDLLLLSQGDGSQPRLVDVCAVAQSTLALAAPEIERSAKLVRDFSAVAPVLASEVRIAQILLNLIGNALEAMRERASRENQLIVRIAPLGDDRVTIEVSDTGRGIAEENLRRVFEPFFTTKGDGQGTGLGLTIAQRLVTELGGELGVTSTLGHGATFRLVLPTGRALDERAEARAHS